MKLWVYVMMASVFCLFMSVKTLHDPNGDALLWLLATPFVFLIAVVFKVTAEDNEEHKKNPEYVKTVELLIPILIIRHWQLIVFVVFCLLYWLFKGP